MDHETDCLDLDLSSHPLAERLNMVSQPLKPQLPYLQTNTSIVVVSFVVMRKKLSL